MIRQLQFTYQIETLIHLFSTKFELAPLFDSIPSIWYRGVGFNNENENKWNKLHAESREENS